MAPLYHQYNFHSNLEYFSQLVSWVRRAWVCSPREVSYVLGSVWTSHGLGTVSETQQLIFCLQGLCLRGSSLNRNTSNLIDTDVNISAGILPHGTGCVPFVIASWDSIVSPALLFHRTLAAETRKRRCIRKEELASHCVIQAWIIPRKEGRAVEMVSDIVESLWLKNVGLFNLWIKYGLLYYFST